MNKDKKFLDSLKKLQEGEEEEFAKVKSNESKSLLENKYREFKTNNNA